MITVSELLSDGDFMEQYIVHRKKGVWKGGRFRFVEREALFYTGVVQPASEKELEQLEIGDRGRSMMKFLCAYPDAIFVTEAGEQTEGQCSDTIEYRGKCYKIVKVKQWQGTGGYCRAFGYEVTDVWKS